MVVVIVDAVEADEARRAEPGECERTLALDRYMRTNRHCIAAINNSSPALIDLGDGSTSQHQHLRQQRRRRRRRRSWTRRERSRLFSMGTIVLVAADFVVVVVVVVDNEQRE